VTLHAEAKGGQAAALSNAVPSCANPFIFHLSHFEKCGYSEEAQRFLDDNYLI
jgi:hypothetical protein